MADLGTTNGTRRPLAICPFGLEKLLMKPGEISVRYLTDLLTGCGSTVPELQCVVFYGC